MVVNEKLYRAIRKFILGIQELIEEQGLDEIGSDGYYKSHDRFSNANGTQQWAPSKISVGRATELAGSTYAENVLYALHNTYKSLLDLLDDYRASGNIVSFGIGMIKNPEIITRLGLEFAYVGHNLAQDPDQRYLLWVVDEK